MIEDNAIVPQTNGALLLDIRLGNIEPAQAAQYAFYNPDDQIAIGLLTATPTAPGLAGTQPEQPPAETSVMPPMISPADAKSRARGGKPKEDETEPVPGDGTGDPGGDSEPPRVEPPDAPPGGDGEGGGGTEPPRVEPPATPPEDGGGGGDGGGGDTPPSGDGAGY